MSDKENYREDILLQQIWEMINQENGKVLMSTNLQSRIQSAFKYYRESYAEQHLEDVLGEVDKKELAQWQHNNYCEILLNNGLANENQLTPFHELSDAEQNAIEELTERLLNLLKQRKG